MHWTVVTKSSDGQLLAINAIFLCRVLSLGILHPMWKGHKEPRTKLVTTAEDWSFHSAVLKLWRRLPTEIQNSHTLNQFKTKLKIHIYCPNTINYYTILISRMTIIFRHLWAPQGGTLAQNKCMHNNNIEEYGHWGMDASIQGCRMYMGIAIIRLS